MLALIALLGVTACGGAATAGDCSLDLRADHGRIRADFRGPDGRVVVVHEGHVAWRGRDRHRFWLDDYRGADRVMVRATARDGGVCSASATLPGEN